MFIYVEFNLKIDLWKCAAVLLWTEEKKSAGSHFYFPLIPALAAGMMMYWPGPWWNARALQWALAPPEGLAGFSSALPNPLQPSQCPHGPPAALAPVPPHLATVWSPNFEHTSLFMLFILFFVNAADSWLMHPDILHRFSVHCVEDLSSLDKGVCVYICVCIYIRVCVYAYKTLLWFTGLYFTYSGLFLLKVGTSRNKITARLYHQLPKFYYGILLLCCVKYV